MPATDDVSAAWRSCCSAWLAAPTNPHTHRAYASDLAAFLGWCPVGLAEVRAQQALAWWQHMIAAGLSISTVRRRLHTLQSLYTYAEFYPGPDSTALRAGYNPFSARWSTALGQAIRAEELRRQPPTDLTPHDPFADAIGKILPRPRLTRPTEEVR